jgi:hypothetical protein
MDVNEEANRLEQTLSGLSLPVRVQGGQVRDGSVRYMATPLNRTRTEQFQQVEGSIALALGVPQVHIVREGDGLAIDVPGGDRDRPRLLPLVRSIGDIPRMTLVVGIDDQDAPLLLPLDQPGTWHVAILGTPGVGKSELLRAMVVSLGLTNRQSVVQFFGIDLGGRELAVLEALPHALSDLATEPRFALELLDWLTEEGLRREKYGILRPDLVLAVDDVVSLIASDRMAGERLGRLADQGNHWGIHIILSGRAASDGASLPWLRTQGWALVKGGVKPGRFTLRASGQAFPFTAAWLPVSDLDLSIRQFRTGRRPGQSTLSYSISGDLRTKSGAAEAVGG